MKQVSVYAISRSILEECGGDVVSATDKMERRVRAERDLFYALMDPLVRKACYDVLREVVRDERRTIWTAPNYTKGGNGDRLVSASLTLLDFRLPHNLLPLREAGKDDLVAGADWYESQANNMQHKARWLRAVAAKVGNKVVGEKFTAEELAKLQEAVA